MCPAGWRWFEMQDAIKKITQKELPDFYNILLERPRDDPDGYDLIFVDAAFMGAFASRMSHSCTPNCQVGGPTAAAVLPGVCACAFSCIGVHLYMLDRASFGLLVWVHVQAAARSVIPMD
jgi:type IV secretory pathway TrbD component